MHFWWVCGRRWAPCSPTLPPWSNFSIYFFPSGELWSVTIHHRSLWVRIFWLLPWSCELWGKLCWIHVVEFFSIATWSFPCRVLLFSLKIGIPIPLSILHHNLIWICNSCLFGEVSTPGYTCCQLRGGWWVLSGGSTLDSCISLGAMDKRVLSWLLV